MSLAPQGHDTVGRGPAGVRQKENIKAWPQKFSYNPLFFKV